MVGLLLYAYCVGTASSCQMEKACKEVIPFRVWAANQHPDPDTTADFWRRHWKQLAALFMQVLRFCQKASLVKLGHVVPDGTKIKAKASKHKTMSYGRMQKGGAELEVEVERLLEEAEAVDQAEDWHYGKGRGGDESPEELRFKQSRLAKIREAKEALEWEAWQKAEQQRCEPEEKEPKENPWSRPSKPSTEEPDPKA